MGDECCWSGGDDAGGGGGEGREKGIESYVEGTIENRSSTMGTWKWRASQSSVNDHDWSALNPRFLTILWPLKSREV